MQVILGFTNEGDVSGLKRYRTSISLLYNDKLPAGRNSEVEAIDKVAKISRYADALERISDLYLATHDRSCVA